MRIIAGTHRGTPLKAPPGLTTRPITDRAKESLFSILESRFGTPGEIPLIRILDLFAGSGSLGMESLSRGARECLFVERDPKALRALRENIAKMRVEGRAWVLRENAWNIRLPGPPAERFGLIFVDPPYRDALDLRRLVGLLERLAPYLAADGKIIVRHGPGLVWPAEPPPGLRQVDHRTFRKMQVVMFELAAGPPAAQESPRGAIEPAAPEPDTAGAPCPRPSG